MPQALPRKGRATNGVVASQPPWGGGEASTIWKLGAATPREDERPWSPAFVHGGLLCYGVAAGGDEASGTQTFVFPLLVFLCFGLAKGGAVRYNSFTAYGGVALPTPYPLFV